MPPYQIISKKPIKSVADFKGMKMRASGLMGMTYARLGARVVTIPPEEIYMGLAQGVIDAATWGTAGETVELKLQEVAKYWITPAVSGNFITSVIVNMDAWKALPDDLKEIVQIAMSNHQEQLRGTFINENMSASPAMAKAGVKISHIPSDEWQNSRKLQMILCWSMPKARPIVLSS